jgi:hypothetical protein
MKNKGIGMMSVTLVKNGNKKFDWNQLPEFYVFLIYLRYGIMCNIIMAQR